MKCPKCGYLGFEAVDRCRNCGYDFSFSVTPAASGLNIPELPMRERRTDLRPLDDLALIDDALAAASAKSAAAELNEVVLSETPVVAEELPLFGGARREEDGEAPLITRPSAPRQPLAV